MSFKKINYSLDFLVVLPAEMPQAEDIAQRFKVSVTIYSPKLNDDEDGVPPGVIRLLGIKQSIDVLIEYSAYEVAMSLQANIDAWVAALKCHKPNKVIAWASRYRMANSAGFIRLFSSVPFLAALLIYSQSASIGNPLLLQVLFVTVVISLVTSGLISIFWEAVSSGAGSLMRQTRLYITTGDNRRHQEESASVRKQIGFAMKTLGLLVGLGLNVFSGLIMTKIITP